ncbi:winged helix-turn-helix domain-containing protein, partial [Roseisolibacter sp. H3M3-2]|uniref:AfsR/SARP family transcriptional regulator n=1 Tax=Roseisolibacter sp. H3M3-2 TaxID=3031323 RepID=UPI0023DA3C77
MLRVVTLGGLAVSHPDRALGRAALQPRPLALLAVLARAGERGASRDALQALFWPGDEERGRRSLAQAVYALRRDLADERAIVGAQELRLDPDAVASDVGEYAEFVRGGRLEEAAALYAGPFLAGFRLAGAPEFERWADDERRAVAGEHARDLERLARAAERAVEPSRAAAWWRA